MNQFSKDKKLAIFEGKKIRREWNEKEEKWYFSVVDVIQALTDSANPTDYLKKLRKRDIELAGYIGTNCPQIEMTTETGKNRKTLAGNPEHLFRIIQSVPSKKAEPIKLWLAKVGYERAELSTRQIAENMEAKGLEENKIPAKKGGRIAKNARLELEQKTGKKVVSGDNLKLQIENKKSLQ